MATALAPVASAPVYSARPTFTFACGDETMTVYRLQVADADGKLLGIFTDGDFRRLVSKGVGAEPGANSPTQTLKHSNTQTLLSAPVANHMTSSPFFVRDDAYAAELLKIFEKKRIDDLPVCDASGRVVGLVDIQDLPKMKVL